jgi:hypothetical protein
VQVTWNGTPLYYELAGGESQEILLNPTPALLNDWVISLAIIIPVFLDLFIVSVVGSVFWMMHHCLIDLLPMVTHGVSQQIS